MKKLTRPSSVIDLMTRAFHEAGHTIVAVAFNIPYKKVTIIPLSKRDGGHVELEAKKINLGVQKGNMKLLRSLCVFCHAGLIAQQTKTPTSPSSGGIEDLAQLQVFLKRMPLRMFIHDKKTDGYLLLTPAQRRAAYQRRSERAYYSARKIVIRYWSVVELLASELLSNKTLSRKEVDAIVKPAMEKCKNL